MSTLLSCAAGLAVVVGMVPAAVAGGGSGEAVKPTTVVITLSDGSEGSKSILRVPDGIDVRVVESMACVVRQLDASQICLRILPKDDITTFVAGGRQAAIRIQPPEVEVFLTDGVPFAFVEALSECVQRIQGVESVSLKLSKYHHRTRRDAPSGSDPFDVPGADAKEAKPEAKSEDPFAFPDSETEEVGDSTSDDPFSFPDAAASQ